MPSKELSYLKSYLDQNPVDQAEFISIADISEGYRQEPVTIAIAVIASSAAAIRALGKVLNTWLEQRGAENRIELSAMKENTRLTIERHGRSKTISLEGLSDIGDD
jgi:hypothetical protein